MEIAFPRSGIFPPSGMNTPSPYMQLYTFWMNPYPPSQSPQQLLMHLIDGPILNQKPYKYIQISYLLKYKHSKN